MKTPTAHRLFGSNCDADPHALDALEAQFFSNVVLPNGTFKTTNHHRMDDLNALVNQHLPDRTLLRLMDVAISSGVSTAEWLLSLDALQRDYHMVGGDLCVNAYLVNTGGGNHVLVDKNGHPLQYGVGDQGIRAAQLRPEDKELIARNFLAVGKMYCVAKLLTPRLRVRAFDSADPKPITMLGFACLPVRLLSASIRKFPKLQVIEDDILTGRVMGSFDVLRAANILSPVYFSDHVLTDMLRNLRSRLLPGGLLIICRTMEKADNHATLFRLTSENRFATVARLGQGSEIETLILNLPP